MVTKQGVKMWKVSLPTHDITVMAKNPVDAITKTVELCADKKEQKTKVHHELLKMIKAITLLGEETMKW